MVLQDIENQAPESFSESPGPSDNDPYASQSSPSLANGERYDASNMPHPIPIIGPFIGFSERALRFKADTTLSFAEKKLGRTLHPDEAQALAFHIYKLERSKSYYAATGAAGGVYRWYATMATYQYPFYKPKIESIDPNKFGPIKGPAANLARQTWRFGLYALVAGQMGNIIGQLISQVSFSQKTIAYCDLKLIYYVITSPSLPTKLPWTPNWRSLQRISKQRVRGTRGRTASAAE